MFLLPLKTLLVFGGRLKTTEIGLRFTLCATISCKFFFPDPTGVRWQKRGDWYGTFTGTFRSHSNQQQDKRLFVSNMFRLFDINGTYLYILFYVCDFILNINIVRLELINIVILETLIRQYTVLILIPSDR